MSGSFYICATPIGNIQDITLRAIDILKQVDYIACEDKRVSCILLKKYDINSKLIDCHKFNEKERSNKIISLLLDGNDIALISDAGTPLISDPGSILLKEILERNINVTSLPGACAVTTFLSRLPRKTEEYSFIGFIPRREKQQIEILNKHKNINCVFYESPLRLIKTLENIAHEYGDEIQISVGRELTKAFEEVKTGSIFEIIDYYKTHTLKGEIVVMIYAQDNNSAEDGSLKTKIELLRQEGYSRKDISKILSLLCNVNKNKIYEIAK